MKSIFDPSFRYSPSYGTDVRKTFERVRREQAGYTHVSAPSSELARKNVLPMPVRQEGKK